MYGKLHFRNEQRMLKKVLETKMLEKYNKVPGGNKRFGSWPLKMQKTEEQF
jgi:hypothetical protein